MFPEWLLTASLSRSLSPSSMPPADPATRLSSRWAILGNASENALSLPLHHLLAFTHNASNDAPLPPISFWSQGDGLGLLWMVWSLRHTRGCVFASHRPAPFDGGRGSSYTFAIVLFWVYHSLPCLMPRSLFLLVPALSPTTSMIGDGDCIYASPYII